MLRDSIFKEKPIQSELEDFFDRLWPLNRSLTGADYRKSLDIPQEFMPHDRLSFPTESMVFDWSVPEEWEMDEAYFICPTGKKIVDLARTVVPEAKIKYIGIRPGEKITECLLTEYESRHAFDYENFYVTKPGKLYRNQVCCCSIKWHSCPSYCVHGRRHRK